MTSASGNHLQMERKKEDSTRTEGKDRTGRLKGTCKEDELSSYSNKKAQFLAVKL